MNKYRGCFSFHILKFLLPVCLEDTMNDDDNSKFKVYLVHPSSKHVVKLPKTISFKKPSGIREEKGGRRQRQPKFCHQVNLKRRFHVNRRC